MVPEWAMSYVMRGLYAGLRLGYVMRGLYDGTRVGFVMRGTCMMTKE